MEALISSGLEQLGLADRVPPCGANQLARYGAALLEKNRVMNLTAITQPKDVATLHMLDCAPLLSCGPLEGKRLIDVGTGAGFPGMVLKILVPSLKVTLLDSLQKRLDWLSQVGQSLGLEALEAVHGRAEEAGADPAFRERYDFAVARAVAELRLLAELCLPFVSVGGCFLAMKGVDCAAELQAAAPTIEALGGAVERLYDYQIPHTEVVHRVVVIKKRAQTPPQYPRRWAKMQKSPILPAL